MKCIYCGKNYDEKEDWTYPWICPECEPRAFKEWCEWVLGKDAPRGGEEETLRRR